MMGKKIKVLRIIARLNVGGPAIHAILLTEALNNERFESILVTGHINTGEKDMSYLAKEKGIRPVVIYEMGRCISPVKDLAALWKIYKLMIREKPDIVHTHTAKAGTLGRVAAILAGVPVKIHTFHGHIFDGYFNKFAASIFLLIERALAGFTKYIVVISEAQKKQIGENYKIGYSGKLRVIPLGLELEKFFLAESRGGALRSEFKIDADTIAIGIIGRLVPVKNHKMFLDTFKRLKKILGNEFKLKSIIVGDGEERAALEKYASEIGIIDYTIFCGWREELSEIYADLDIVALTSLNEGTPVSLIEALASALPVIATDVGGVRDIVEDGVNGCLVASGDTEAFAKGLADLIRSPLKRRIFGKAGREKVRENFSKERLVRDISNLYEESILS
ncbi:MAG: glycosyltransferase family 4 protein [Candidatus Omnitrophota bacterium]